MVSTLSQKNPLPATLPAVSPPSPSSVRVIGVLGSGRAAQARLVDATMPNGDVIRCVEKVFAPGKLTRLIYRLGFQAPFAYQKNRDAILTAFYRRRVAAAVLKLHGNPTTVAMPTYVRYDNESKSWVLAAQWIQGRGVKPAAAKTNRLSTWCKQLFGATRVSPKDATTNTPEIVQLVAKMRELESQFQQAGLYGSGWQVSPRALVSTANLLRINDAYCVIDLESGIPAVLDLRYLVQGLRRAVAPPFDDLDQQQLANWHDDNKSQAELWLGVSASETLSTDIDSLIHHSRRWKQSELALLRQPWRWLRSETWRNYQLETFRQWKQDAIVDQATGRQLEARPIKAAAIWWARLLPGKFGRALARCIGRADSRKSLQNFLLDKSFRKRQIRQYRSDKIQQWQQADRVGKNSTPTGIRFLFNQALAATTPVQIHRLVSRRVVRNHAVSRALLLCTSAVYRQRTVERRIEKSIQNWHDDQRITSHEATRLRSELVGAEIKAYIQGAGLHIAIKALAPIMIPAKLGGIAAFFASGNFWFLLPLLLAPILRVLAVVYNACVHRKHGVSHTEALMICWIPTIGSAAFPFQMFANRPLLSTFLLREAASKLAQRVPIYGGKDSRTEMAFVKSTDYLIELSQFAVRLLRWIRRYKPADARVEGTA